MQPVIGLYNIPYNLHVHKNVPHLHYTSSCFAHQQVEHNLYFTNSFCTCMCMYMYVFCKFYRQPLDVAQSSLIAIQ